MDPTSRKVNLRDLQMSMDMGKDVRDTTVLSGTATRTKAENETNKTVQYENKGGTAGDTWGGMNKAK